jgi:hypothetical protein
VITLVALLTLVSPVDHTVLGYVQPNGTIENATHAVIGWLRRTEREWVVESKNHAVLGYVQFDGTVQDAGRRIRGRLRANVFEDASGRVERRFRPPQDFAAQITAVFFF